MILITGAGGMLGRYLTEEFQKEKVKTLGLREDADFRVDLTANEPEFGSEAFSTVIHCAGTEEDSSAMALNLEGTRRLLASLEEFVPENFVYVSSYKVYSHDAGENVTEDANTWATGPVGQSKALAEKCVQEWCEKRDVTLTIIRPARMFGNGVKGDTLQLFNDAISGKYIHIRGNDARVSLVTALDVAKAIKRVYKSGGIYNAADGRNPRLIEMVEAMTANAGAKKRMTHLPAPWAEWLWRIARFVPSIRRNLAPDVAAERMKTITLDGRRLAETAGIKYHDTIEVMELNDPDYPYSFKETNEGDGFTRHTPRAQELH